MIFYGPDKDKNKTSSQEEIDNNISILKDILKSGIFDFINNQETRE